jgi:acyl dehydratase
VWEEPVCAGDTLTTTVRVLDLYERGGMGFFVFESVSTNQHGDQTVRGMWTNIVRRH